MNRLTRFFSNTGAIAIAQCAIVGIILFFAMRKDVASGLWIITLPVLLVSFFAGYPVRNWLVDHLRLTRILMNSVAVAGMICVVVLRRLKGEEPVAVRIALAAFIGLYMGLYFWLMSDQRITRG